MNGKNREIGNGGGRRKKMVVVVRVAVVKEREGSRLPAMISAAANISVCLAGMSLLSGKSIMYGFYFGMICLC
ncbi:unnamed protein product [Trifolium pratense]|uniref:Uncharacterized protein n=1 Tax=Trifolium pratense TaxID=57577 RepID=A0ACB0ISP1_TRIPR|nr:unnamed protein product [Trifolium pratense]